MITNLLPFNAMVIIFLIKCMPFIHQLTARAILFKKRNKTETASRFPSLMDPRAKKMFQSQTLYLMETKVDVQERERASMDYSETRLFMTAVGRFHDQFACDVVIRDHYKY
jgi:hypothetical protein